MTVSSSDRKSGPFNGNGVSTLFPFYFRVFDRAQLLVVYTDAAGNESTLTLDSNYDVTLNDEQEFDPGGTVTYPHPTAIEPVPAPLPSGCKLTILGNVPFDQETDITNAGGFYPEVIEDALDKLTMQTQQLKEEVGRAVLVPVSGDIEPEDYFTEIVQYRDEAVASAASAAGSASAAAESAVLASDAAQVVEDNLDAINIIVDNETAIQNVGNNIDDVTEVSDNLLYVNVVGNDLGGSGWSYDLGLITDPSTDPPATHDSYIRSAYDHLDEIQAAPAAAAAAETALDTFTDQYLGAKSSDPTFDNDGNALIVGAMYFNTTDNILKVWNGTNWVYPGPETVGGYGFSISGLQTNDVLQFGGAAWVNQPQTQLTDGGNF